MSWQYSTQDKSNLTEVLVVQTVGFTQTFTPNTLDKILVWNRVLRDELSQWNNTTATFTAKEAGNYVVNAKLLFTAVNQTGDRFMYMLKNGTSFVNMDYKAAAGNATYTFLNGFTTVRLAANDTLTFAIVTNQIATISHNDPAYNSLTITQLFS